MDFKVYIIYSASYDLYYKGVTTDLQKRINDHNQGFSRFTKNKGPWKLVFYKSFEDKKKALQYEMMLKRQNRKYLIWLISNDINELL